MEEIVKVSNSNMVSELVGPGISHLSNQRGVCEGRPHIGVLVKLAISLDFYCSGGKGETKLKSIRK